jgi:hypothetical protein
MENGKWKMRTRTEDGGRRTEDGKRRREGRKLKFRKLSRGFARRPWCNGDNAEIGIGERMGVNQGESRLIKANQGDQSEMEEEGGGNGKWKMENADEDGGRMTESGGGKGES